MKFSRQKAIATLVKSPTLGIKTKTLLDAAGLVAKIKAGKVNKERLRNVQFSLLADIFLKQITTKDVNLGILFTNHIAGNMHRYWYGLFPEDYRLKLYDEKWMSKYSHEILVAIDLFDKMLGKLIAYCDSHQSALILVSSMGQAANHELKEIEKYSYRLENIPKFIDKLCPKKNYQFQVNAAMVPQYSLSFDSAAEAQACYQDIETACNSMKNIELRSDINNNVITLTANLFYGKERFFVRGESYSETDLGFRRVAIEDHHSGRHSPEGSLVIYNSPISSTTQDTVDYLEYAPAMLEYFGLKIPEYMLTPRFTI